MRFKVEHTFRGITLADYETLYFNEDFNIALCNAVKLSRNPIKSERSDEKIARVVRVGPDREVPKPVAKILGADRIEYEEHVNYTFGSYKGTWKTIPNLLANKVTSQGTFTFSEVSGGVKRIVDGEIGVKILGVGGLVEKFIVGDVEKSYDDAAAFTQKYINENKPNS